MMLEKIIAYFAKRHLLTNFITIGIFIFGIFSWSVMPKEELPDLEMNFVQISAVYPGASPEEIEHFLTKPIEDEIKGIDGIEKVTSSSTVSFCTISAEIADGVDDASEVVNDINDAVNRVSLPSEVRDRPLVRQFKTSRKAIIDIGLINKNEHLLDNKSRQELQKFALVLEQQLISLSEVSSVRKSGYLKPEIQIRAKPEKLQQYNISLSAISNAIRDGHVREPAGNIEDISESKVVIRADLDETEKLKKQIIRGGFEGQEVRLHQLADVVDTFEKSKSINKINGHQGIFLNVVKSSSYGIIDAVEAVKARVKMFQDYSLKSSPIDVVILDDESRDVRQRLSLIGLNGAIGFIFILVTLLFFLNVRAGFWVAIGIPFSFCFTLVITYFMGYTINNVTLAAVIIVMGMVVDDAIVVAENISRMRSEGYDSLEASVKGTAYVFLPIVASTITTCVAFFPMLLFKGHFAKFISFIPSIIAIMLLGSLIESLIILPAHMNLSIPRWLRVLFSLGTLPMIEKYFNDRNAKRKKSKEQKESEEYSHWFIVVEEIYGKFLYKLLNKKIFVYSFFIGLLFLSGFVFSKTMKFVMFPDEEATQIGIRAEAPEGTTKYQTAQMATEIESVFKDYLGKEVVGFRTNIAQSRFGRIVEENKLGMRIEIVSPENREKSLKQLKKEWMKRIDKIKGFKTIKIREHRFGHASGSPIEIMVQENDNNIRRKVVDEISKSIENHGAISDVEIDRPMYNPEYRIGLKRELVNKLSIKSSEIAKTFRSILQGTILYELMNEDDEIDVRVTSVDRAKRNINNVLEFPVENNGSYLVPLKSIVNIEKVVSPYSIHREDFKRSTKIYANMHKSGDKKSKGHEKNQKKKLPKKSDQIKKKKKIFMTPLEFAEMFEAKILPGIQEKYPTSIVSFTGEIQDTRESRGDFKFGIIAVLFLIYTILAVLFNSMIKPFIIMIAIPFGIVGIILAFWMHGIAFLGFFGAVGAIGLTGVVVNDSIVMIAKLETEYDMKKQRELGDDQIAAIAKTRLRAVVLTTITTVAGVFPTAYGIAGYDAMLAQMMLAMGWGLIFGTLITLILVPTVYASIKHLDHILHRLK